MSRSLVVMAMLVPFLVEVTSGSAAEAPISGARIRVTAPTFIGNRLVGTLVGLDETTLRLQREGKEPLDVPRASIVRVEVSRHRSRKRQGAQNGLLVGLGAAIAVGLATGEKNCDAIAGDDFLGRLNRAFCFDRGETALLTGILTVPAGIVLGILAAPGEKWDVVNADRLRFTVAPQREGVRAALAIRF